jgi:hypothetical protein
MRCVRLYEADYVDIVLAPVDGLKCPYCGHVAAVRSVADLMVVDRGEWRRWDPDSGAPPPETFSITSVAA